MITHTQITPDREKGKKGRGKEFVRLPYLTTQCYIENKDQKLLDRFL